MPIRFQDHAQGIAHYLQTPRIGYYSIDLTGVPQGVQAVQVCHPLDIVDYGSEWSSVLLLGNAQLLRYGLENIGLGGNDRVLFGRRWGGVAGGVTGGGVGGGAKGGTGGIAGGFSTIFTPSLLSPLLAPLSAALLANFAEGSGGGLSRYFCPSWGDPVSAPFLVGLFDQSPL